MRRVPIVIALLVALLPLAQPAGAATVTVATAGDIARASLGTPQQQTAGLVTAFNPTAVFALGDEQYPQGSLADFETYYDASWGAFKSITYPIPGNHEYETPGAAGYYGYFGAAAGRRARGYYSFDIGNWHVLALNSECKQIDCTAEKSWMKADLAADTHLCEVAMYHRSGLAWPRKLMEAGGGDLALAGHHHVYERWAGENGLVRFTVGTGGYSLGTPDPGAIVGIATYGILELTLQGSSYSWSFVDTSGTVQDSGLKNCHS
jgi:acid phosphatase type 7